MSVFSATFALALIAVHVFDPEVGPKLARVLGRCVDFDLGLRFDSGGGVCTNTRCVNVSWKRIGKSGSSLVDVPRARPTWVGLRHESTCGKCERRV